MVREVCRYLFVMSVYYHIFVEGGCFLLHYDQLARELILIDGVWWDRLGLSLSVALDYLNEMDEVDVSSYDLK